MISHTKEPADLDHLGQWCPNLSKHSDMDDHAKRPSYWPSGRIDPRRLVVGLALLMAVSTGIAVLFYGMLCTYYLAVIGVLPAAFAAKSFSSRIVKSSHCRSPMLAGILGAACGAVGYLGYFHLDQCLRWGEPWTAVDQLPGFIAFRMDTDDWERVGEGVMLVPQPSAAGVRPVRPLPNANALSWNWINLFYELAMLSVCPLVAAAAAARIPYSEKRRQWFSEEILLLEREAGTSLQNALAVGAIDAWLASSPRKVAGHETHCAVSLRYVPAEEGQEPETEVFLSLKAGVYWLLTPEEAAAIVQLLPGLRSLATLSRQGPNSDGRHADDPTHACFWPVPPPYAGQCNTPALRLIRRGLLWGLMLSGVILPILLLPGGTHLMHELWKKDLLPEGAIVVYVLAAGALSLVFIRFWYMSQPPAWMMLHQRFTAWLIRRTIARRPDALIDAHDPEALVAQMCPRRLWSGAKPRQGEYNDGLLRIDMEHGELVFEGDYERYLIPAEAIFNGTLEAPPQYPSTQAAVYLVVLEVRVADEVWEAPFFPFVGVPGDNDWERASALLDRIELLCGREFDRPSPPPFKARH